MWVVGGNMMSARWKGRWVRKCSKPGCSRSAVATLTYDYHDSTAVLGPLATNAQPHTYDLCEVHAESMTVPRGWQVMRLQTKFEPAPPSGDDLLALVEVIRDVAGAETQPEEREHVAPPMNHPGPGAGRFAPPKRGERFEVITGEQEE